MKFLYTIRYSFLLLFFFLSIHKIAAQSEADTLQAIKELSAVNVLAVPDTDHHLLIDSAFLQSAPDRLDLALERLPAVTLRRYGVSGLSTVSFRGMSPSHTKLFWHGIPIDAPSLGQTDFSTLPASFFDRLSIHTGASRLRFGHGAFGAVMNLENSPSNSPTGLDFTNTYGSFSSSNHELNTRLRHSRFSWQNSISYSRARNNFPFNFQGEERRQGNAERERLSVLQSFEKKIRLSGRLSAVLWAQDQARRLPPPATRYESSERQQDDFLRLMLNYKIVKPKGNSWSFSAAHSRERLLYENPVSNLRSITRTRSVFFRAESELFLSEKFRLHSGLMLRNEGSEVTGTYDFKQLRRGELWLHGVWEISSRHHTEISFRQEAQDGLLTPAVALAHTFRKKDSNTLKELKLSLLRDYRLPTLNDLYWIPGGNPELKPEESLGGILSLKYRKFFGRFAFSAHSEAQYQYINDRILWAPEGSVWSPQNIREVRQQALEAGLRLEYSVGNHKFAVSESLQVTEVQNMSETLNDGSNPQLIYIPRLANRFQVFYANKHWGKASFFSNWTSRRFTTSDNSYFLPDYMVFDFHAEFPALFRASSFQLESGFRINNIFNMAYQGVAFFPMPGRNAEVWLRVRI